jgi:hypothetical protein
VQDIFVDAAAQRRYRANFERHVQHWQAACRETGATMAQVIAEPWVEQHELSPLVEARILRPA